MYWINVAQLLNRHLRRLHKLAHQLTSGLFIMCLLVISQHSYGFDRGEEPGGDVGASVGGSVRWFHWRRLVWRRHRGRFF